MKLLAFPAGVLPAAAATIAAACSSNDEGSSTSPERPDTSAESGRRSDSRFDAGFGKSEEGGLVDAGAETRPPSPRGDGHITMRLPDGHWHRLLAREGSSPEDLTSLMDSLSNGQDSFVNVSKNGDWLVALGSRFGCVNGGCLGRMVSDLLNGELVTPSGRSINALGGRPAVSAGGDVIVYSARGPHALDLYAVKRVGSTWSAPVLLTGSSPFAYHHDVALAWDGTRAVFDCGGDLYGVPPTSLCEASTDGSEFNEVLAPSDGPDHGSSHALHHPDYTPEGDVVFEADWPAEQVWKVLRGSRSPVLISPADQGDDNSPCVLPDGRIVSLWLGRPGNRAGAHEIKVMRSDGTQSAMILTGIDVVDVGIGCGN